MHCLISSKKELLEVDVLLATFNGELYLAEQLDSLLNQVGVVINLLVSDDGSTDATVDILNQFREKFFTFKFFKGPGIGPAANFMYLLSKSTGKFVAFCDQDDVWNPEHLMNSVDKLGINQPNPRLTFSSMIPFSESEATFQPWPSKRFSPTIHKFIAENHARGCTIVMNRAAVKLILSRNSKKMIMHDWWCVLVVLTCGEVFYIKEPQIRYRIHEKNFTKKKERNLNLKVKFLVTRRWEPRSQLVELFQLHRDDMNEYEQAYIENTLKFFEGNLFTRIFGLILNRDRFRSKFKDEIFLRIGFLFKMNS